MDPGNPSPSSGLDDPLVCPHPPTQGSDAILNSGPIVPKVWTLPLTAPCPPSVCATCCVDGPPAALPCTSLHQSTHWPVPPGTLELTTVTDWGHQATPSPCAHIRLLMARRQTGTFWKALEMLLGDSRPKMGHRVPGLGLGPATIPQLLSSKCSPQRVLVHATVSSVETEAWMQSGPAGLVGPQEGSMSVCPGLMWRPKPSLSGNRVLCIGAPG